MKPLDLHHTDTCLPDYFSGDSRPWLCIPVHNGMTFKATREALLSELAQDAIGGCFDCSEMEGFHKRAKAAINRCIVPAYKGARAAFKGLPDDGEDGESIYAYFVFTDKDSTAFVV